MISQLYYSRAATFWDLEAANLTSYEEEALVYTLQGLVNRVEYDDDTHKDAPELFFNTGRKNIDFPSSDKMWVEYFVTYRHLRFATPPDPTICALVENYKSIFNESVVYFESDGFSIYIAMTIAGLDNVLPVSSNLIQKHSCLSKLRVARRVQNFEDKFEAYRWAIDNLLPRTNPTLLFNADHYHNAVQSQGAATIMSVDYPIQNKAFIMNLCPLWKCDPLDCGKGGGRVPTPRETALYVEILESKAELVSVWGWSRSRTCIYKYYIQRGRRCILYIFYAQFIVLEIAFSVLWLKAFSRAKARLRPKADE